jgi:transketolase
MPEAAAVNRAALDELCINTIRTLAMDAVERAKSGHPGTPMALAPVGYVLWTRHLRHNPANPAWAGRDRFVLSCGHASMLLYALLHLTGYDLSLEDLIDFRQWGSRTPGHPERGHTPGVETTTGPLGQGVGNAVGMAIAARYLAAQFDRPDSPVNDHRVYFLASDGDFMEGISHEACSLAGHLGLGNLIGLFDDNGITIDGPATLSCSDDVRRRFEAYGWQVLSVEDGNDLQAVDRALQAAKDETARPSLIMVRTHIGFGSPHKQDSSAAHGAPLGEEEVRLTKENLGWPYPEPFTVPPEAYEVWREALPRGAQLEAEWKARFERYAAAHPDLAGELGRRLAGDLPAGWEQALPAFGVDAGAMATRSASGRVLNALASAVPELVGGSADLAGSNNTLIKGEQPLGAECHGGRNLYFGIREHGMAAVLNGMALHGGVVPYGGTFLVFSDYMRPSIRLGAMMGLGVVYVFTHDSIGLGEDGPTHQPVEMLATLRAVPNLVVLRPADASETAEAWKVALARRHGPTALVLTRQAVPTLDRAVVAPASGVARGAYVLVEARDGAPAVILLASGSEVSLALEARETLEAEGVPTRVVSMASMELFASQPGAYRHEVLPPGVEVRVAIEAAHPMPWRQWVGDRGDVVGLRHFGASAPYERLYEEFGITAAEVVDRAKRLMAT